MNLPRRPARPRRADELRDEMFFRMTAPLFTAQFCVGACALLASYDADVASTLLRLKPV
jgi:hypothetical protein